MCLYRHILFSVVHSSCLQMESQSAKHVKFSIVRVGIQANENGQMILQLNQEILSGL